MKKIGVLITCIIVLLSCTVFVSASWFYDISGDTNIAGTLTGVNIVGISRTTEGVDQLIIHTGTYVDDVYMGLMQRTVDDTDFVGVSASKSYYGFIYVTSYHEANDWTGDEWTSSDCAYIR